MGIQAHDLTIISRASHRTAQFLVILFTDCFTTFNRSRNH